MAEKSEGLVGFRHVARFRIHVISVELSFAPTLVAPFSGMDTLVGVPWCSMHLPLCRAGFSQG